MEDMKKKKEEHKTGKIAIEQKNLAPSPSKTENNRYKNGE